ncbi:P-loop containing nucleoside triphosphate hydrolase protein, partial [Dimargaris cristalligena]
FEDLIQNPQLLKALQTSGFQSPSPIQWKAIPLGRLGLDLIAQAKSGTGKTIVFSVLAIEGAAAAVGLHTIILAPTREIAFQSYTVIQHLSELMGLSICDYFIGGTPYADDVAKATKCHIAVGTPGRLSQLLINGAFQTHSFRTLILDEADKLMEESFQSTVQDIAQLLPRPHQTLAFSATYNETLLAKLEKNLMHQPQHVRLTQSGPTLSGVRQFYLEIPIEPTSAPARFQLQQSKQKAIADLFTHLPFYQCLIFLNHHQRGPQLADYLTHLGYPAVWISSHLNQAERLDVMRKARAFQIRVIVSSDLMARGIDIDRVDLVINWDMPWDPETYFHRVGRTGRFGSIGYTVSLVAPTLEGPMLHRLQTEFKVSL